MCVQYAFKYFVLQTTLSVFSRKLLHNIIYLRIFIYIRSRVSRACVGVWVGAHCATFYLFSFFFLFFLPSLNHDTYADAKRHDANERGGGRYVFVHLRKTWYAQVAVVVDATVVAVQVHRHYSWNIVIVHCKWHCTEVYRCYTITVIVMTITIIMRSMIIRIWKNRSAVGLGNDNITNNSAERCHYFVWANYSTFMRFYYACE